MKYLEADDRAGVFVRHSFEEDIVDLGEVRLNYATAGDPEQPALLLVPGQSNSWWSYEKVMPILAGHFQVFAVDLRGQGRSTWTPGRYTLDNFGGDLVRFIDLVIRRPVIAAGHSSGGTVAAWLSAFAKPGQVRASMWEDTPIFSSETSPSCGQSIHQGIGPVFAARNKWLGDQWSIGDYAGMRRAFPAEVPVPVLTALAGFLPSGAGQPDEPPQNLREYDPEWGKAFVSGSATASCDHENMVSHVTGPVLFTHHFHQVDEATGTLTGALSDLQAQRAGQLVSAGGQTFTYRSFPQMPHSMHEHDPGLYADTLTSWATALDLAVARPECGRGEQAQVPGPGDGFGAAVGAQLGVDVAHVGLDGVVRHRQFAGDLRPGQVGRQIAQYA
jgi:pimeloyl-ACP methyl ester carboxylesterase